MEKNRALKEASVISVYLTIDSEGDTFIRDSYASQNKIVAMCITDYIEYASYKNMVVSQLEEWLLDEFGGRCTLVIEYGVVDNSTLNIIIKTPNSNSEHYCDGNLTCSKVDNETST